MSRMPSWASARSNSGKLYFIILLFVAIGLLQFFVAKMQADILYAVRAYVAGEGLWSKAQKNGMQNLLRYAATRDETYYKGFLQDLAVPLGDKQARLELLKPKPDLAAAHKGFIQGGNHAADVESLIWLFENFRSLPPMAKAINIWTEGDEQIARTLELAEKLHQSIAGGRTQREYAGLMAELEHANARLTFLEDRFSLTLGEAARWVRKVSGLFAFFATLVLLLTGAWLAVRIIRSAREAEAALSESEHKFRSSFSHAAVGMAMTGLDGGFLQVNRTLCDMLGYGEDELLRLNFRAITHPDDLGRSNADVETLMSGAADHFVREKRYLRKDGAVVAAVTSVALVRDAEKKPLHFIAQVNDISARVKAEDELKRAHSEQNTILENAIVGIALLRNGRIVWTNQRFSDIVDLAPGKLIGVDFGSFFAAPEAREEFMTAAHPVLQSGESFTAEAPFRTGGGKDYWARIAGKAIDPRDMQQGSIWLLEDVTEKKKAQTALIEAKEKAEEATRLKDKFVSLVSHDLKGPLGGISSSLQFILSLDKGEMPDDSRKLLEHAHTTSLNVLRMIDELLNIGRLKTGKLKPQKAFLNASRLVAKVTEDFRAAAEQKGITLTRDIPAAARLYADPSLLAEVLANLLSNALKFTDRGGTVSIGPLNEGRSGLAVADTGRGIKQEYLEHLFSYDHKTSTAGIDGETGSGLGLPLCKDILAAHGGDLAIASAPGKGTTCTITLPSVQPVILLVGADPALASRLSGALETEGVSMVYANDGIDAVSRLASREAVHLVAAIADVPLSDGRNLMKALRDAPATKDVPVILLTEGHKESALEKYRLLDADGLLDVVSEFGDLLPCVKRFLG